MLTGIYRQTLQEFKTDSGENNICLKIVWVVILYSDTLSNHVPFLLWFSCNIELRVFQGEDEISIDHIQICKANRLVGLMAS